MRRVRWLSWGVLLLAIVYFVSYNWNELRTRDTLGPVIYMEEETIYASVEDGDEVLLQGMTAEDVKDGDVTASLVVESVSDFVEGNKRYVNYAAFDSDNHVSKTSRKLVYTDYEPIRFSLSAPLRFPITYSNTTNILGNVHAQDCLDGDISDNIKFAVGSYVYTYYTGEYPVELEVSNSAGDTVKLPVTIVIYDAQAEARAPKIALTDYLVYTKVGEKLDPKNYIDSVTWLTTEYEPTNDRGTFGVDTSEMLPEELEAFRLEQEENPTVSYERFTILDRTDYRTPGVYEIEYFLEDGSGNQGRVNLIVVVEEE